MWSVHLSDTIPVAQIHFMCLEEKRLGLFFFSDLRPVLLTSYRDKIPVMKLSYGDLRSWKLIL